MAQPLDVIVVGQALNDQGLCAFNTIAGLGLNTFGFLWPCDGIWQSSEDPITTSWVAASIPSSTTEVCMD
jgi:hypothetical protein